MPVNARDHSGFDQIQLPPVTLVACKLCSWHLSPYWTLLPAVGIVEG